MKILILALVTFALCKAETFDSVFDLSSFFGYLVKYGIPEAERIRKMEEEYLNEASRVAGGAPAELGVNPWQAGLLIDLIGLPGRAICGGSLVSSQRVITAGHCWDDGQSKAWRFTVVLGSVTIFKGGTRLETSVVITHPSWTPSLFRNDIAIAYLPNAVTSSKVITPIALPTGSLLTESFAGESVFASGFGLTRDGASISVNQVLSRVSLNVITNTVCSYAFPRYIKPSHICTSSIGGTSTCRGDSGGPLVAFRDGTPILIGATSFGSAFGCEIGLPAVFARISSFIDFINQHL